VDLLLTPVTRVRTHVGITSTRHPAARRRHQHADFREGRARYEQMRDSHHDHLINLRDGKGIEFTNEEIEKLQAEIARKLGYRLVDHRLELYCVPLDDDKS